ncbi:MAG: hypothetical protein NZL91_08970 [Thermoflexales bacterium]|nr:hypothetical protein [Thermoflexales bacterium]
MLRLWKRVHLSTAALAAFGMALALLVGTTSAAAQVSHLPPHAIVVDDTDSHFVRFGPPQYWWTSTGTSFSYYGGSMVWTWNEAVTLTNFARWHLPLSAMLPLTYEVFAFIPRYNATTRSARYHIVRGSAAAPITTTRVVSQNRYYAEWVSLGQHYFQPGELNFVQLDDVTGEQAGTRRVGFDALAFVPIGIEGTSPLTQHVFLPFVSGAPFAYTTSRYISTINPQHHEYMGCAAGQAREQGVIILAFGQPWAQNGQYGVLYYRSGFTFASTATIAEAVKGFLRGYWTCAPSFASLTLGVGTNNYRGATGFEHGRAWGQMINQLHTWLSTAAPQDAAARIRVLGANDIEMSWNGPITTLAWVQGYATATSLPFINFGTCDGCPTTGSPNRQPNNGWTVEQVWQVNSGVALPFPEIYLRSGVNADQWYRMSLYAATQKGAKLDFIGLLTQWQACQDVGGCVGTDNTPRQGWEQLQAALNADPRTAMPLPFPSDITWRVITQPLGSSFTPYDTARVEGVAAVLDATPAGDGVIIEGIAPPAPASRFLAENVWHGSVRLGDRVQTRLVFAGRVRDPALGGVDEEIRGGVLVVEALLGAWFTVDAPEGTRTLRIVGAEGAVLRLSDGARTLRFDVRSTQWLE